MRRTVTALAGVLLAVGVAAAPPAAAASYKNCTELQKSFPNGVGRANAVDRTSVKPVTTFKRDTAEYNRAMRAKPDLDRDRDGIACEKR